MANPKSYMKKPPKSVKITSDPSTGTYEGVALAALEVSRQMTEQLRAIKAALNSGNTNAALALMREFLGLYELNDEGGCCEERVQ